jgi:hypothetical protein
MLEKKSAQLKDLELLQVGLQRGSQLASIYGEDPYTQTTCRDRSI